MSSKQVALMRLCRRIFTENIVRNAIKHSPDRGVIKIFVNVDLNEIHISVTDQGTGVPAVDLEKYLSLFIVVIQQKQLRGHGLGLAIAHRVSAKL